MSSNRNSSSGLSFVSESVLEERRKRRQEEWEKSRTEDMPLEAPEEEYDSRTLYDRLREQKTKKDEEFEESRKLKHLIKGLDNEEITFLEMVDNNKIQIETQRLKEEVEAIEEYKRAVSHLNNEEQEKRLNAFKKDIFSKNFVSNENNSNKSAKKSSQSALLANVVRKRTQSDENEDKTPKKLKSEDNKSKSISTTSETSIKPSESVESSDTSIKCIGVLPGLGLYANSDSSDSDNSSNSDVEKIDFNLIVRHKRQTSAPETKPDSTQTHQ